MAGSGGAVLSGVVVAVSSGSVVGARSGASVPAVASVVSAAPSSSLEHAATTSAAVIPTAVNRRRVPWRLVPVISAPPLPRRPHGRRFGNLSGATGGTPTRTTRLRARVFRHGAHARSRERSAMIRLGVVRSLLAAVLFGATVPAASELAGEMPAFTLAGLLYLGAAAATAPALLAAPPSRRALRAEWRPALV